MAGVNWDARLLELARHVAGWSKDPSTKVGAVIVDLQRRIVGMGYNGFPRGCDDAPELYADRAKKYARVVHAEANAILNATRPLDFACMYLTHPPCAECSKLIIQSGIGWVGYPEPSKELVDRWPSILDGIGLLKEAGLNVEVLPP